MEGIELSPEAHQLVNDILVWIGFGTLVGLVAKAIMPGRDPGGAVATMLMGVCGSVMGCGCVSFFYESKRITPISPLGALVAVAGAFVLLLFYRILAGYIPIDGEGYGVRFARRLVQPRRKRYSSAVYED